MDQFDLLASNTLSLVTFNVLGSSAFGHLFWNYDDSLVTCPKYIDINNLISKNLPTHVASINQLTLFAFKALRLIIFDVLRILALGHSFWSYENTLIAWSKRKI
jgi:hypothetical protein